MLISSIIFVFSVIYHVKGCVKNVLHEHMTVPELAYYFNTGDKDSISDYEVIYLPVIFPTRESFGAEESSKEIDYKLHAFGRPINLKLKKNTNLLSKHFQSHIVYGDEYKKLLPFPRENCHYLHKDSSFVAAFSICEPKALQGLILLDNATLEIHPLTQRLQSIIKVQEPLLEYDLEETVPHIVKRVALKPEFFESGAFPIANNLLSKNMNIQENEVEAASSHRPVGSGLTLELSMFFDEAGYKIFAPYMKYDEQKLQDMLLAYMNGVQALYHHPSLGTQLELVLVRLDIMKRQPYKMPHYDGERSKLLDSFCEYQNSINPKGDSNPYHWDMALYISGLDFFAYENGHKSGVTMGLATVGGVCLDKYACIIAEFGTTNIFGKPYPSAGFTSVYILAHEIGHNLGMHHDGTSNSCSKEGYVMSPSRGTNGETQWSTCSAEVMRKLSSVQCLKDYAHPASTNLDHTRFSDSPGQTYTAKKQCEILLRDKDAVVSPNQKLSTICYSMKCKTPHRSGYYDAGPALQGTTCGRGRYCYGGDCIESTPPKPVTIRPGGWSPWKMEKCRSGCIEKSLGYQNKSRNCNNPVPVNTDAGCQGNSYEVTLCNDSKVCASRMSVVSYASQKCKEFSRLLPELDSNGAGLQAPHEEARVWMGCAIFCKRADSGSYYTPRIELNDLGVSPYFLDGTWCHNSNGINYYCLQHHCLPENFQFTKSHSILNGIGDDIPIPQNAHPLFNVPPGFRNYLSLGPDGKPIEKTLRPDVTKVFKEEDWETNDYIELPHTKNDVFEENELDADDLMLL